ncbi:ABC transporter ATP-binding protein [uncultured Bifidobacterium sp.]|uniref:ABC transporter ATP-binding protein n=1 Tax=uncultured Bifidobacterium sp. TaxID=165187 RepID=UPI0028DCE8A9|nr:ABC transporter ATP-binding protein [uncultured Bifidobacterium sp.]
MSTTTITPTSEKVERSSHGLPDDIALRVTDVAKAFRLPTEQATGLKQAFINWTRGVKGYRIQEVLRDISFDVHRGDFFGIVGRNGSGKSTLLKIISGIYAPNEGTVCINGKLVPFIELGVGFNPELTGRENVYLNGALLGFSRDEIAGMYDDIVEFAELGEFMDQKLKNYSSGMQVRLAFSVAIKAQGDILVLDEVLAVGDEAFQRKCNDFFSEIKKDPSKTVILVTHSMDSVKKYCNKAILIKDGRIVVAGDKNEAADRYTVENLKSLAPKTDESRNASSAHEYPTGLNARCPLLKATVVGDGVAAAKDHIVFDVDYRFDEDIPFYLAFSFTDIKRGGISYDSGSIRMTESGRRRVRFSVPLTPFTSTDFRVIVSLREDDPNDPHETKMIAFTNDRNACLFSVRNEDESSAYALLSSDVLPFSKEYIHVVENDASEVG